MTIEQLVQRYSTLPDSVRLRFHTERWTDLPGQRVQQLPDNALGLVGEGIVTKVEMKASHKKGKAYDKNKPKRYQEFLVVHRAMGQLSRGDETTPAMEGLLASVPDCSHSHLVLELNVLAYLLKLPGQIQLGAYVHGDDEVEFIQVQRVPDLTKALLNDAYVRSRVVTERPAAETVAESGAAAPNASGAARPNSRTGAAPGSSAASAPAPSGTSPVQQVRGSLQQQELFSL